MRKIRCLFVGLLVLSFCNSISSKEIAIYIHHNYRNDTPGAVVKIDWESISERLNTTNPDEIQLFDVTLGEEVPFSIYSVSDTLPQWFYFHSDFSDNSSYKTYTLTTGNSNNINFNPLPNDTIALLDSNENITYRFLTKYSDYIEKYGAINCMADKVVSSIFTFYPEPGNLNWAAAGRWHYETGYFLDVVFKYMELKKNMDHLDYIKSWVDLFIDDKGDFKPRVYRKDRYRLDDINAGRLFIDLYNLTKDDRYKNATEILIQHLREQPKTSDGGYWHKEVYAHQMWLDGIFMADVFSTQYAKTFNDPEFYDEAILQIRLMHQHAFDTATGLLYHGWDESKERIWANPETGASPSFWSRGIGWYMMALLGCLDNIPLDHPNRAYVMVIFKNLAESIVKFQDPETGMWYQVTDKMGEPGNWFETSGTAMFAYSLAKGVRMGYIEPKYLDNAKKAYDGLLNNHVYFDDDGLFYITMTVMVGTLNEASSDGSYNYYIGVLRRTNDFKGVSPFLDLCNELELY
ncbi:MAG: glycoside hydrolase family 88 protein [Bacteroidales bacterium]|nr:glycoside hydrolase family 88 protein [Bacteroidales bacterium]